MDGAWYLFLAAVVLLGIYHWRVRRDLRRLWEDVRKLSGSHPPLPPSSGLRLPWSQIWVELVTVRERLEKLHADIHEEEFNLRAIMASMVEGVVVVDRQSRIRMANEAFGNIFPSRLSPQGRPLMDVLRQDSIRRILESTFAQGTGQSADLVIEKAVHDRNNRLVLEVNSSPLRDTDGTISGAVLVFHDISELKRLEDVRRDFVANVSHELRTPLSVLKGYLETLSDQKHVSREEYQRVFGILSRHAERLTFIVNDLLKLCHLESGRVELEREHLCPAEYLPRLVKGMQELMPSHARQFVLEQACERQVLADSHLIEQVLYNLLDNAVKYSSLKNVDGSVREARIFVGARPAPEGNAVDFYVRDTGRGIPSDKLSMIFERFYRVDKARSRETGGTGLGLSIVKHIILLHHGKVWAQSELGKGTTIWFRLPCVGGQGQVPGGGRIEASSAA